MQLSQGSKWIWANNCPYDKNCYCEFADKFLVNNPNDGAQVRICADNRYVLWINGRFVSLGQYTDYPNRAIFNTVDISDFIVTGENTLRILVYYKGTPLLPDSILCFQGFPPCFSDGTDNTASC